MKPSKWLGFEVAAKAWLDAAAQVYAQRAGIALTGGVGSAGSSSEVQ
jgi:hypothetical protein